MSTTLSAFLTSKITEELVNVLKTAVDNTQSDVETLITNTFNTLISNVQSSIDTATVASNIASALESDITNQLQTLVQNIATDIQSNSLPTIVSDFTSALSSSLTSTDTLSSITSSVVPTFTNSLSTALTNEVPNIVTQLESLIIDKASQELSLPTSLSELKASVDALTTEVQNLESQVASAVPAPITVTCVSGCTAVSSSGSAPDKSWLVMLSGSDDFTVTQVPITITGTVLPADPSAPATMTLVLPSGNSTTVEIFTAPAWLSTCSDNDCFTKANLAVPIPLHYEVLVSEVKFSNVKGTISVRGGW